MIETSSRIKGVEEYYFSRKLAEVRQLDTPELRVINLGIGSPDLMPAPDVITSLTITAMQPGAHGYQSYKGVPLFRQRIAEFYDRVYQVKLDPETQILPLMGSKEGIFHISMAYLNEGEGVLVPDPGYPTYSSVTNLCGGKIVPYVLTDANDWRIDFEALENSDLSGIKLMWINYPHMPTGTIATKEELTRLVNLARKHNFLLVNDNPYSLILNESPLSVLSIPGAFEVAIELNSLSKSHNMAGWRVGWVAGDATIINNILKVKSNMDSGMFLGIQQAAASALQLGPEWHEGLNKEYRIRKAAACKILDLLGCTYREQSGLFVWAKAPDGIEDVEAWLNTILYGTKVFITPGFIFGATGQRYIRISLCTTEEVFNQAFSRIKDFLNARK